MEKMQNIFDFYTEVLKNDLEKVNFRRKVMEATGWAYSTFYYKLHHLNLSPAERTVINPIISNFQFS